MGPYDATSSLSQCSITSQLVAVHQQKSEEDRRMIDSNLYYYIYIYNINIYIYVCTLYIITKRKILPILFCLLYSLVDMSVPALP